MKTLALMLAFVFLSMSVSAQEAESSDWNIMPSVVLVKYFPSERINGPVIQPLIYPPIDWYPYSVNYAATGLNFSARCFNNDFKPVAFTFGGGVNWYYRPELDMMFAASPQQSGVGRMIRGGDFTAFPLSVGVQAIYPYDSSDKLMMYGGIEGNLQLISGNIEISEQAKAGYSLVGGFAVKVFEFGVRYTSFSDIRNLGVQFGIRFKTFSF